MRPQLGSWPKNALLARLEPATERAACRVSSGRRLVGLGRMMIPLHSWPLLLLFPPGMPPLTYEPHDCMSQVTSASVMACPPHSGPLT